MPVLTRKSIDISANLIVLGTAFAVLFGHTIADLVRNWMSDDNYSHGFLILPIAAYMIWQKKEKLAKIPIESAKLGLIIILTGLMLFFLGNIAAELFIIRFSLIITILGICLFYFGFGITAQIIIPIAYLLFMIPVPAIIWNKIAFPLQLMAAKMTTYVIQIAGVPILREGNILYLPNATLEVVDACSGLRSLTSMLALSGAFAYIVPLGNSSKWILFLAAVPIALFANIARLCFTAAIALSIGQQAAQGFLHEMSGLFVFVVAIILLYFTYQALVRWTKRRQNNKQEA